MVHEMSRLDPAEADHAQRACDKARQPALDAKYKGDLAQKALRQPAARQLRDEARAACREAEAFAEEVGRAHDRLKAIQRAREDAARCVVLHTPRPSGWQDACGAFVKGQCTGAT